MSDSQIKMTSKRARRKSLKMALSRRFSAQSRAQSDMAHDIRNRINEINELRRAAGQRDHTIKKLNQQLAKCQLQNEIFESNNQLLNETLHDNQIDQKRRENELKSEFLDARKRKTEPTVKELHETMKYVEQLRAELLTKTALTEKLKNQLLSKSDQISELQQNTRQLKQQLKERNQKELLDLKDSRFRLQLTPRGGGGGSHLKTHSLSLSPSPRRPCSQPTSSESPEREIMKLRSQVEHYKQQLGRRLLQEEQDSILNDQQEQSAQSVALSLSQKFEERQDDIDEMRRKLKTKQASIWRLMVTISKKEQTIKGQLEQLQDFKKVHLIRQRRLDELEEEHELLQHDFHDLDEKLHKSDTKLATQRKLNKKLQQLRFQKKCPVNGEFDKVHQHDKDLELQMERMQNEMDQKCDECAQLQRQLQKKELPRNSKKLKSQRAEIIDLKQKLRLNDHELMTLRSDLNQSQIQSTLLSQSPPESSNKASLDKNSAKQLSKLKSQLADYKSRVKAAEKEKQDALNELETLNNQVNSSPQTDDDQTHEELQKARAQLQSAQTQIQLKQNEINEIQNLLKECRTQLALLTDTAPQSQIMANDRNHSTNSHNSNSSHSNSTTKANGYVFGAASSPALNTSSSFFPAVEETPLVNRSTSNFKNNQ